MTVAEQTFLSHDGTEITLRPAKEDDAVQIVKNLRSTSQERSYILTEYCGASSEKCMYHIRDLEPEKNLLLVAVVGDTVVGSLGALQLDEGTRAESRDILAIGLHITAAYRGMGIGSNMLAYVEEWAHAHGYKKITASIFTTNQRSLALFIKAGFEQKNIKEKRIRIGSSYIDEALMTKVLT